MNTAHFFPQPKPGGDKHASWIRFCTAGFAWQAPELCKVDGKVERCASGGHFKSDSGKAKLKGVFKYLLTTDCEDAKALVLKLLADGSLFCCCRKEMCMGEPVPSKAQLFDYADWSTRKCGIVPQGDPVKCRHGIYDEGFCSICAGLVPVPKVGNEYELDFEFDKSKYSKREVFDISKAVTPEARAKDTARKIGEIENELKVLAAKEAEKRAATALEDAKKFKTYFVDHPIKFQGKYVGAYPNPQEPPHSNLKYDKLSSSLTFDIAGWNRLRDGQHNEPLTPLEQWINQWFAWDLKEIKGVPQTKQTKQALIPLHRQTPQQRILKMYDFVFPNEEDKQQRIEEQRWLEQQWRLKAHDRGFLDLEEEEEEDPRQQQKEELSARTWCSILYPNALKTKPENGTLQQGRAYRTTETVPAYTFPVNADCLENYYADEVSALEFGKYKRSVTCFDKDDEFRNACESLSLLNPPAKPTVRYIEPCEETREELEKCITKYPWSYRGEDRSDELATYRADSTLNTFLSVGTVFVSKRSRGRLFLIPKECKSVFMFQKTNGAWYIGKPYRDTDGKAQREELYLGADVCSKGASAEKKRAMSAAARQRISDAQRRQALKFCTKKSKAAFKAREWEEWMKWRSIRYALRQAIAADDPLHQAGSIGSEEGGGWSSIYTASKNEGYALLLHIHDYLSKEPQPHTKDVYDAIEIIEHNYAYENAVYEGNKVTDAMSKQSWLYSLEKHRKQLDSAHRSARGGVFNYDDDDYNEQDKNAALLKPQALVSFGATEDGEDEVATPKELSTTEEPTEEPKDETEEEILKKKPKREKSENRKKVLKNETVYRAVRCATSPYYKYKEDWKVPTLVLSPLCGVWTANAIGTGIRGGYRTVWAHDEEDVESVVHELRTAEDLQSWKEIKEAEFDELLKEEYVETAAKREDKDKRCRSYEIRLVPCPVCRSTTGECSS